MHIDPDKTTPLGSNVLLRVDEDGWDEEVSSKIIIPDQAKYKSRRCEVLKIGPKVDLGRYPLKPRDGKTPGTFVHTRSQPDEEWGPWDKKQRLALIDQRYLWAMEVTA